MNKNFIFWERVCISSWIDLFFDFLIINLNLYSVRFSWKKSSGPNSYSAHLFNLTSSSFKVVLRMMW